MYGVAPDAQRGPDRGHALLKSGVLRAMVNGGGLAEAETRLFKDLFHIHAEKPVIIDDDGIGMEGITKKNQSPTL